MNITEFVNKYSIQKSDDARESFLEAAIKTTYIPICNKVSLCQHIKEISVPVSDMIPQEVLQYVVFMMCIIDAYTIISIDNNQSDLLIGYDKLRSNNLIQMLFSLIPEEELTELNMVFESLSQDI